TARRPARRDAGGTCARSSARVVPSSCSALSRMSEPPPIIPGRPARQGARAAFGPSGAQKRRGAHRGPRRIDTEEVGGVLVQQLLPRRRRQRGLRADQAPDLLLTEREGIVGTEHDAVL